MKIHANSMQLSKRLTAVAALVTRGTVLADVGTDHAYLPIYLVQEGKISRAIAMDVREGPLMRAREHIAQAGLQENICVRRSDGLQALSPKEAKSVLIAGMGGPLTVRILREGSEHLEGCRELILQPQSDIEQVRRYLQEISWRIVQEDMVLEQGNYYPMLRAMPAGAAFASMTPVQLLYGPLLLEQRHPVLQSFLQKEQKVYRQILTALEGRNNERAGRRRAEIEEALRLTEEALRGF